MMCKSQAHMTCNPTPVTAAVLTLNEGKRLGACLASLGWAADRLIVDGGSADDTAAVASAADARLVVSRLLGPDRPGGFSDQRNFALDQASADWVLFVDADERVTPELAESIRATIEAWTPGKPVAYRMRRREHFFGVHSPYTHGEGWQTRLVRRADVRWDGRAVHEGLIFDGGLGDLEGELLHYSKDTVQAYVHTMNRYTSLEAQEAFARRPIPPQTPIPAIIRNVLHRYLYMGSYREGTFGLLMSLMFGVYAYLTWAKHWELAKDAGLIAGETRPGRVTAAVAGALRAAWHGAGRVRRIGGRR